MRKRKQIIFRLIKILLLLIGVGLLVYGLISFLREDFWRIKQIDCQVNSHDCSVELKGELMRLFQGENFLFLSSSAAAERVRKSPLKISTVVVKKRFPSGLVFQLGERQARVAIVKKGAAQNEFYLVDQDGFLLEKTTDSVNLPLVFTDHLPEIEIGRQFEESALRMTIAALVDLQLRLLKPRFAQINSSKEIELWLEGDTQAIVSLEKNLDFQLGSLQLIFSRTKIEGEPPRRIDLRFDKPVISYDQK